MAYHVKILCKTIQTIFTPKPGNDFIYIKHPTDIAKQHLKAGTYQEAAVGGITESDNPSTFIQEN